MVLSVTAPRQLTQCEVYEELLRSRELTLIHLAIVVRNNPPARTTMAAQKVEILSIINDLPTEEDNILREDKGYARLLIAKKVLTLFCRNFEISPVPRYLTIMPSRSLLTHAVVSTAPELDAATHSAATGSDSDVSDTDSTDSEGPLLEENSYRYRPGLNPVKEFFAVVKSEEEKLRIYKSLLDPVTKKEARLSGSASLNLIIHDSLIPAALASIIGRENEDEMCALFHRQLELFAEIYKGYELIVPSNILDYEGHLEVQESLSLDRSKLIESKSKSVYDWYNLLQICQSTIEYCKRIRASQETLVFQLTQFIEKFSQYEFEKKIPEEDRTCTRILRDFHVVKFILLWVAGICRDFEVGLPEIIEAKLALIPSCMSEYYEMVDREILNTIVPDVQILDICEDVPVLINNTKAIEQICSLMTKFYDCVKVYPKPIQAQLGRIILKSCFNRAQNDLEKMQGESFDLAALEKKYWCCLQVIGTSKISQSLEALLTA